MGNLKRLLQLRTSGFQISNYLCNENKMWEYFVISDTISVLSLPKNGSSSIALLAQEYANKELVKESRNDLMYKHFDDMNKLYWHEIRSSVGSQVKPKNKKIVLIYRDPVERVISSHRVIDSECSLKDYLSNVIYVIKNYGFTNINRHLYPQHLMFNMDDINEFVELKDINSFLQSVKLQRTEINKTPIDFHDTNDVEIFKLKEVLRDLYKDDYKMIENIPSYKRFNSLTLKTETTKEKGIIFDVGCYIGDSTKRFAAMNNKVVAIDANPLFIEKAKEELGKKATFICAAIGNKDTTTLWVSEYSVWTSTHKEIASRDNTPCTPIDIPCVNVADLMDKYGKPYYCKIDIEQDDLLALRQINGRYHPKYISCETECIGDRPLKDGEDLAVITMLKDMDYDAFCLVDQQTHSIMGTPYYMLDAFPEAIKRECWMTFDDVCAIVRNFDRRTLHNPWCFWVDVFATNRKEVDK